MTLQQVKAAFRKHGIEKVKLGGSDIDGILRGKYISMHKFLSAAESSFGFCDVIFGWDSADALYDNVRLTGWQTGYPDLQAHIDLSTLRIIPWEPCTAFFLVDFVLPDGHPFPASPRYVLQRVIERGEKLGYTPRVAAEYEYFFFRETPQSAHDKHYRQMVPLSPGMFGYSVLRTSVHSGFAHDILNTCQAMDVELEGFHTETGPGVYETAIKYDHALRAADKAALFKTIVKVVAQRHGYLATFMAKWNESLPGCSGHVHQSLLDRRGARNLFYDAADKNSMSALMRQYMAGQMELMPEFMAMICPTINSYKRTVPGTWAPTNVTWGTDNRTTALRAIPAGPKGTRVEYRLAGADGNPYLSIAAGLASGLYGVEKKRKLPPPTANAYEAHDAPALPRDLEEATRLFRSSRPAREYFGEEFVEHFAATREWEVRQFQKAVTDWELERYFEII
jgi:glutamine synthetase